MPFSFLLSPHSIHPLYDSTALIGDLLTPNIFQLLNHQQIRIQKAIHTVLRAALLALIQSLILDRAGDALGPADVGQVVDSCISCQ